MSTGIDFKPVVDDTASGVLEAVLYILGLSISPADKKARIAKAVGLIGTDFYNQMFDANSEVFGSMALKAAGYSELAEQTSRLSTKILRNAALNRDVQQLMRSYYDAVLSRAQEEAFRNAVSLERHPTLKRTIFGETCKWCLAMAGTHVDPTPEMFGRHENCDCKFRVSGYGSRNGKLKNYNKRGQKGSK